VFTDGSTQWYGSDEGVARHIGTEAKENWTLFAESDGLVNNHVQAINKGHDGIMWFGTKGGVSAFDETNWTNYTTGNGLVANHVLCIAIDIDGSIWFGTDNGVSHFDGNKWTSYQADE
jgi:ligand-binding sensor domain-containing protein